MNRPKILTKLNIQKSLFKHLLLTHIDIVNVTEYIDHLESQLKDQEGTKFTKYAKTEIDDALRLVQDFRKRQDNDESALDIKVKNARYLLTGVKPVFLLPTHEEIGKESKENPNILSRVKFIEGALWLKSQIKVIPKELVDELRDSLFDAVQALKWWQDEYPQGKGKEDDDKIKKFEDLIQHLTEKEQV